MIAVVLWLSAASAQAACTITSAGIVPAPISPRTFVAESVGAFAVTTEMYWVGYFNRIYTYSPPDHLTEFIGPINSSPEPPFYDGPASSATLGPVIRATPSTDGSYLFYVSQSELRAISVPAGYVTTIFYQIMGAALYVSPNPSLGLFVIDNTCVRWYAYSISEVALSSAVIIIGSCGPNSPPASLPTPPVAGSAIRLKSPTCILASTPGTLWVYDSGYGRLLKFTFNSTTTQATLVASLAVVNPIRWMHQDSVSAYVMQEGSCLASRIVENANGTFALSQLMGIAEPPSCSLRPFAGVWWTDDGGILRDVFIVTNNSLIFQQAASDCIPIAPQQTSTVTPTATGTSVLPTPTTTSAATPTTGAPAAPPNTTAASTATTAIPPTSTAAATTERGTTTEPPTPTTTSSGNTTRAPTTTKSPNGNTKGESDNSTVTIVIVVVVVVLIVLFIAAGLVLLVLRRRDRASLRRAASSSTKYGPDPSDLEMTRTTPPLSGSNTAAAVNDGDEEPGASPIIAPSKGRDAAAQSPQPQAARVGTPLSLNANHLQGASRTPIGAGAPATHSGLATHGARRGSEELALTASRLSFRFDTSAERSNDQLPTAARSVDHGTRRMSALQSSAGSGSHHFVVQTPTSSGSTGETKRQRTVRRLIQDGGYQKGKLLGRGANGSVYAVLLRDGSTVAMKEINLIGAEEEIREQMVEAEKEMTLIQGIRHPCLVQYYAVVCDPRALSVRLFMELVTGGSLGALVRSLPEKLEEATVRIFTAQMLQGLVAMHARDIVHRDLKGDNILRDSNTGRVKIADFGTARLLGSTKRGRSRAARTMIGTPFFMAPEIFSMEDDDANSGYGAKADVWSLGITVAELLNRGNPPWPNFPSPGHAFLYIGSPQGVPIMPEGLSAECQDFIRQCTMRDPATRPSAQDLVTHAWLVSPTDPDAAELDGSMSDPSETSPSMIPAQS
jgi:serine/threonine protein kinase